MNIDSRFSIKRRKKLHKFKNNNYNLAFYIFMIILVVIMIFALILEIVNSSLLPVIVTLAKTNVESRLATITNENINRALRETELSSLIKLQQNTNAEVTALEANIIEMNQLALKIADDIEQEFNQNEPIYLKVALGNAFDNSFLANRGPKVSIKILVYGSVKTKFKTEFETAGINQTRHKIYLDVNTSALITLPMSKQSFTVNLEVPVSETVIIGNVPNSFVEFNGLTS